MKHLSSLSKIASKKTRYYVCLVRVLVRFDCKCLTISVCCGEEGIRTPGTLLEYIRFPSVPLQPLEHLSMERIAKVQKNYDMIYDSDIPLKISFAFSVVILSTSATDIA